MVKNINNTLNLYINSVNLNNNVEEKYVHYDISVTLEHTLSVFHGHILRQGKTREDVQ